MKKEVKTELCANSLDDICLIKDLPFTSIELNSGAEVDGLTPSVNLLKQARKLTDAKLYTMIRPRAGGFCYSEELYEQMKEDAVLMLENGADGIVFGFLKEDGTLDEERTAEFTELAHFYGRTATFHKAVDVAANREETLRKLQEIGVDRILTSPLNIPEFRQYVKTIELAGGGGVNSTNAAALVNAYGITSLHFSAKEVIQDNFGSYYRVNRDEVIRIMEAISRKGETSC